MKFGDLPQEIFEKCKENTNLQGGTFNPESDIYDSIGGGGFRWASSPEGDEFWIDVLQERKYNIFYERYPPRNGFKIESIFPKENKTIYTGKCNGRNVKITIEYE